MYCRNDVLTGISAYDEPVNSLPERLLLTAVLELAVRDLYSTCAEHKRSAILWFRNFNVPDSSQLNYFSFDQIVELLELQSGIVKFLKNLVNEADAKYGETKIERVANRKRFRLIAEGDGIFRKEEVGSVQKRGRTVRYFYPPSPKKLAHRVITKS